MMRKNIFNELNERNTIFKNEQVFSPEYLPEEVLFRDKEMYEIAYHFLPLLKKSDTSLMPAIISTENIAERL